MVQDKHGIKIPRMLLEWRTTILVLNEVRLGDRMLCNTLNENLSRVYFYLS